MRKATFVFAFCTIAGSAVRPVFAFEWYEHKRMGDLAFSVAHKYAGKPDVPKQLGEAKAGMDEFLAEKELSYGEVVQCVDYFLFPEKILAQIAFESKLSPALLKRLRTDCTEEGIAFFQATHGNHAHFQQDLLMSLEMWHRMAVALGRDRNYPFALWVNAISDHYLHDMFAPGHIITPRDRTTDVPATAMHDKANRHGVLFAPQNSETVKPILEFLAEDRDLLEELRCPLDRKGKIETAQGKCFSVAQVRESVSELVAGVKEPVIFRGDTHLWDHDREQLKQRVWLLAVDVRSILDVFDKSLFPNHVTDADFKYQSTETELAASFSFGEYKFDGKSMQEGDRRLKAAADGGDRPKSKHLYQQGDSFFHVGVSAHREHQSSGSRTGRGVYSAEMSFFNGTTPRANQIWEGLRALNITGLLGYSYYREEGVKGMGPTMRIFFAIPETEFSTGPYFRWLTYQTAGGEVRKSSWGWRMDTGFSGFATLYLALGRDYGADDQGALKRGNLWQGGIQIEVPISRVRFLEFLR